MPTLDEIKSQIKNLGMYSFLGKKEIKELPEILSEDERVEKIVEGLYNQYNGIFVCSNKRLIFVDKGLLYGLIVEDFPIEKVNSIQCKTSLLFGKLTINSSGNETVIDHVDKKQAKSFCNYVTTKLNSKENVTGTTNVEIKENLISQLEKLAQLKEKGILSDEEFDKAKTKILSDS